MDGNFIAAVAVNSLIVAYSYGRVIATLEAIKKTLSDQGERIIHLERKDE